MALLLNVYKNYEMTDIAKSYNIGIAGITGYYANQSNWIRYSYQADKGDIFFVNPSAANFAGVTLSGGGIIYDYAFNASIPYQDTVDTDYMSNDSQTLIHNPVLTGKSENHAYFLQMWCTQNSDSTATSHPFVVRMGYYTQSPQTGQRQTWLYNISSYTFKPERSVSIPTHSTFTLVKIYKLTIWETDFYMIAAGINASGQSSPTNNTMLFLIPTAYFEDKEVKPYVGPVSKESAANAYIGSRSKDAITPRNVTVSPNPYGFNSISGLTLAKMSNSQYTQLIFQIYNGVSGNIMNQAGQVISDLVGGGGKRPADEVQAIINGIFCCHAVPVIGGYPSTGNVQLKSICGYDVITQQTLATVNPLQQSQIASGVIPRQTGSFLDFAPYTKCELTIPYFGNVSIDPSAIIGNALSLDFAIDLYTGVAICTVSIIDSASGVSWIYTTIQAKIATEMPLIGAGANGYSIGRLANGVMNLAHNMGGIYGAIGAGYMIMDGLQTAPQSVPVTRGGASDSNVFLAPYECYLTITTPDNYNAGDYWELAGVPSHMSGSVGSFSGFTVFEHVDLSDVSGATDAELSEIENTLHGGVWL